MLLVMLVTFVSINDLINLSILFFLYAASSALKSLPLLF